MKSAISGDGNDMFEEYCIEGYSWNTFFDVTSEKMILSIEKFANSDTVYFVSIDRKNDVIKYYSYNYDDGVSAEEESVCCNNKVYLVSGLQLLILDMENCSKILKVDLPRNYYNISYSNNKIFLSNTSAKTLIFNIDDLKEKTSISGFDINNIKIENIREQIANMLNVAKNEILKITNYDGEELKTGSNVGTGTKVKVKEGNSEKEYTIVIYGDITGDGEINALDALALIKGINNKVSFKSEIHKEAGRILVGESEEPTALDALAIVKAANKKYTINQLK